MNNNDQEPQPLPLGLPLSFNSRSPRPHNCPNCHCKSQCSAYLPSPKTSSLLHTLSPTNYKTIPIPSSSLSNYSIVNNHEQQSILQNAQPIKNINIGIGCKGVNLGNIYYQRTSNNNSNKNSNRRRDSQCSVGSNRSIGSIGSNCSRDSKGIHRNINIYRNRQKIIVSPSKIQQSNNHTRVNIRYMSPSSNFNNNYVSPSKNNYNYQQNAMSGKSSPIYYQQYQPTINSCRNNKPINQQSYQSTYTPNQNSNIIDSNGQKYSSIITPVKHQSIINSDDDNIPKQPSILSRKKSIDRLKSTKLSRVDSMPSSSHSSSKPQSIQQNKMTDNVLQKQNVTAQPIQSHTQKQQEVQHQQKQSTISAILSRKAIKSSSLPSAKYQIMNNKWGQPSACDLILQQQEERVIAGQISRDLKLNFDYYQATDITKTTS